MLFNTIEHDRSHISLAYIAGIFDGEGCVSIRKSDRVTFSIEMRDPQAIRLISSVLRLKSSHYFRKDQDYYIWRVESSRKNLVKRFLTSILPYVRVKKDQIKVALSFFEEKNKEKRIKLANKCKKLKKSAWTTSK